jgi:RNA polymerase sigma-70 factor (ECF subfamily)
MAARVSKLGAWLGRPAETTVDWNAVYAEQLPRVFNYLRYRVGDDALAQDLTSVVFEKAWRNRDKYRADLAGFSTWLFSIARNTAADHFRSQPPEMPLDDALAATPDDLPDRLAEIRDETARLMRALSSLNANERDVLALKHGAGMTNRAIAALTGLSESNVGTLAQRGLARLRELWPQPSQQSTRAQGE